MEDDFKFPTSSNNVADDMDDGDFPDDKPALKVGEEAQIGKAGLKKKLLKEGEGWETPGSGDEVEGIWIIRISYFWLQFVADMIFIFVGKHFKACFYRIITNLAIGQSMIIVTTLIRICSRKHFKAYFYTIITNLAIG